MNPENMIKAPNPVAGMRHVALSVGRLEACERFYVDVLGMKVEWRPDADNVYLTSGNDNIALHRAPSGSVASGPQRLDHIGFIVRKPDEVDAWYAFLLAQGVPTWEAACLGVHLHGVAGDHLRDRLGDAGLLASDLLGELPRVRRELQRHRSNGERRIGFTPR